MADKTEVSRAGDGSKSVQEQAARNGMWLMPPVDVVEDEGGITLFADIPGVSKDKLSLQIEADMLTIEGEVDIPAPAGLEPSYAEVGLPRYRRMFTLSKELEPSKVAAELREGVLKLRVPKAEHAKPRRIEVKVS